jgi:hypothetical protein
MTINQEDYLKNRLDDQISWYSKKSASNQRMYKRLQMITIITAASIPFLSGYSDFHEIVKIVIGLIGVIIASITAILSLNKYQENWMEYRTAAESLKHQKYLYLTGSDPYHGENAFNVLVQQVEMLISKENSNWSQQIRNPAAQKDKS